MVDDVEQASVLAERDREGALAAHVAEQERQRRIDESMKGYDPSQPVYCHDCGEIVSPHRLKCYPHTRRCTPCASEIEATQWNR